MDLNQNMEDREAGSAAVSQGSCTLTQGLEQMTETSQQDKDKDKASLNSATQVASHRGDGTN